MDIPYIQSPSKNACALACHQMTARSFFPDISLAEIAKICRWEEGYVVWGFPFWLWMMEQRIHITEYDNLDYKLWAQHGLDGLRKTSGEDAFGYISKWTKNLDIYTDEIKQCFAHPRFKNVHRNATIQDLRANISGQTVCEIVLDSCTLNNKAGFALHRVIPLELSDHEIVFHDPAVPDVAPMPRRSEKIVHFLKSWEKGGELCVYSL